MMNARGDCLLLLSLAEYDYPVPPLGSEDEKQRIWQKNSKCMGHGLSAMTKN